MPTRFLPIGIDDINNPDVITPIHEIIEKYLFDNWIDSIINKSTISFSYKIGRATTTTNTKNSVKCYDAGTSFDGLELNDTFSKDIVNVRIIVESRHINNYVEDTPPDLTAIRIAIRDLINGDRLALNHRGIFLMSFVDSGEITQDPDNNYVYKTNLFVRCNVFLDKIQV